MPKIRQNYEKYELEGLQRFVERWRKEVKCNSFNAFGKVLGIAPQTAESRAETPGKFCLDDLKKMDKVEQLVPSDISAILSYIGISEKRIREFARSYEKQ